MSVQFLKSVDGNQAAAHVAYALSDISFLFPITPATSMGELADVWAETGRKNIWGQKVDICPMQSEAGVSGAIHGATVSGAIVSTFTCSQGLLLMIPNMFKIAGEVQPLVIHVASRAAGGQSLTIFADNNDVMATRASGFAYLNSHTVQEVADMALVAHLSTLQGGVPFMHFFDGFRTSHEISKIQLPEYDAIAKLVDREAVQRLRDRALNPLHPHLVGTVEGSDVFFQNEEHHNHFYNSLPEIVEANMRKVEETFGRSYHIFEYYGHPEPESIIVMMGAGVPTTEEALDTLVKKEGKKWGLVKVRLFRPWSTEHFLKTIPKSVKRIAVIERTKEPGSSGEPLFLDVVMSFNNVEPHPYIIGGRYGLGGKEYTPGCVRAVFQNLESEKPVNHFTVNILDDCTHLNIPMCPEFNTIPEGTTQCMFWGLGADGTVGANHDAIKIIGDNTDQYVQGYFFYDAHKSGGLTVSHLRFGKTPIRSEYLIVEADYLACHFPSYVRTYDMAKHVKEGGIFALNCPWNAQELEQHIPPKMKRELARKKVQLWTVDASAIAERVGLGRRVNTVMQAVFFRLSGVLPVDQALKLLKEAVERTYRIKGAKIIDMNIRAIDAAIDGLHKVEIPEMWATIGDEDLLVVEKCSNPVPEFIRDVIRPSNRMEGDALPVSKFMEKGVNPMGTTRFEKRGIAAQIPKWDSTKCVQCNECSLFCPHAAIRPFVLTEEEAKGMETKEGKGKLAGMRFRIQVSSMDCTGCGVCANGCRFHALQMQPATGEVMADEAENWKRVEPRAGVAPRGAGLFPRDTAMGSQYYQPLLEFSGCCDGCGETPIIKAATQLFGERMVIANAAGCSSVWGGTWGMIPYCTNHDGHGPAWGNSLFEDNAEYGFGMARANMQRRRYMRSLLEKATEAGFGLSEATVALIKKWIEVFDKDENPGDLAKELTEAIKKEYAAGSDELKEKLKEIHANLDMLVKISYWIIGGDGWAYDIDYGGLDHVVAMGSNVNVIVLDTEIYSNTGGQRSKSTNIGAIAKFASGGNRKFKKDLGMMFMSYGDIYVASISIHANPAQAIMALKEAESYPGTSVILAYAPCKEHGFPLTKIVEEAHTAIDSGYWPLYRFDPRKKPCLQIDSKATTVPLRDFLVRENRYAALVRQNKDLADELFGKLADSKVAQMERLKHMSLATVEKATAALDKKEEEKKE